MKTVQVVLFLFLISGILCACINEGNKSIFHFYWDQTYCADPWEYSGGGDSALKKTVEKYLIDQGILGARVSFSTEEGSRQDCYACHCTSGTRILVEVPFQFWEKMEDLGFKKR